MLEAKYSPEVKQRAVQLVLDEGYSYKRAAEKVKEEFGLEAAPGKATIYAWVKSERKRREKEKPPEEPAEGTTSEPIETPDLPVQEKPPVIPVEQTAQKIQESIVQVEEPKVKEEPVQKEEEKPPLTKRLTKNPLMIMAVIIGIAALAYVVYRLSRPKVVYVPVEQPKPPEPEPEPERSKPDVKKPITAWDLPI